MRVEATTGLDSALFTELVALVHDRVGSRRPARGRTPALGLARAVQLVLFLARHNGSQAAAAELFAVSQATVSRLWRRLLPVIALAVAELLPRLVELRGRIVLVDGTLIPTWNWRDVPGLYSGSNSSEPGADHLNKLQ